MITKLMNTYKLTVILSLFFTIFFFSVASANQENIIDDQISDPSWVIDFLDEFNEFNSDNWQDQILWVNNEDQCYVPNNLHNTREISNGTLKIRVVDLGEKRTCNNVDKWGKQHPPTQYVSGRLASKNKKEFIKGKWTARLRVPNSGQNGMFPAWWILGAQNNEPPVQQQNENVCWPLEGSGEIDIFEHHSDGGPDRYTARMIKSLGYCDGGDWKSMMHEVETNLNEYHEYSVEWLGDDLIYRLDGNEVYRNVGQSKMFPEPFFAILNFAKINDASMEENWMIEVDWVKHEKSVNQ